MPSEGTRDLVEKLFETYRFLPTKVQQKRGVSIV